MIAPIIAGLGKPRLNNGSRHSIDLAPDVSELRYRRLFETAQDRILILDGVDGRIIHANEISL